MEERAGLPIRAFADLAAWEKWLAAQPRSSPGVWLKLAKAGAGVASFAALHGASLALFGVKGLAVLALAWITQRRAS